MKAKEKRFLHFLEGSDKHFVIPVYQRNYDWKKEHCAQLFDDLIDLSKSKRTHFLGSVVSLYHDDGDDREYLIIDGQQRLTTLSLLLIAIYKLLDEGVYEASITKDQIMDEYLINKYSKEEKKIRLKPVKNDKNAFASLFSESDDYFPDTNITLNYFYFYDRIRKSEITVDDLFSAIKQLVIVEIELKNGEDDPQLIFESLNSTGLDLTEADKVRNFVLMKEKSSNQERFYNEYWNKIEVNTNYSVSDFIRHYLTIKERVIPNKSKVYLYFKNFVASSALGTEELLSDLLKFSEYYKEIISPNSGRSPFSIPLSKINRLESVVTYPFLMEVFDDYAEDLLAENEVHELFETIISFVFRRLICEVPTNSLNKIFMVLGREIKKFDDFENNYFEIFKRVITQKSHSQRFPNDDEFISKIITKDIYNFQNKNKLFLLEQLENFENKERVDIESLVSTNELTVEHIMPQTLTPKWRKSLGKDYESVHEKHLHTLGNITLTGYNSKMSNRSFIDKRDMDKGFNESRLFLNGMLSGLDIWNEATIEERAEILKIRAMEIWQFPESSYQPSKENLRVFTLSDDDTNFTGEAIASFKIIEDKEIPVTSWKDFFKKVSNILFELDPMEFRRAAENQGYIYSGERKKDAVKIDDFYLYANLNIEAFLSRLRMLANEISLDLDEVSFTLQETHKHKLA